MLPTILTERQYKILKFLFDFIQTHSTAPSLREVQEEFGYSDVSTVRDHIRALKEKGYVRSTGKHRGLRLEKGRTNQLFGLPVYASIGAGKPSYLDDEVVRFITPDEGVPGSADYGFVVRGESMIPTLYPDDEVFVREEGFSEKEGIVVATLEDHGVIRGITKRLTQRNGCWVLLSDNPAYPSYTLNEAAIIGRIVEMRRRL